MAIKFFWHIHHKGCIVEPATEPIENRIFYIKEFKPADEAELRLRLLQPVQGKLPKAVLDAGANFVEADEAWHKAHLEKDGIGSADFKLFRVRDVYLAAMIYNKEAIDALHAKECPDCTWNGTTIFPDKEG